MREKHLDDVRVMFDLVNNIFKARGRDFSKCELCGADIPEGKHQLHHMKYEGATLADIRIVCRKCNMQPENKGLT